MQVISIAECSNEYFGPSLSYHLSFVIKIFVLSIFEWPLKTGLTVNVKLSILSLKIASEYDQEIPQSHTAD